MEEAYFATAIGNKETMTTESKSREIKGQAGSQKKRSRKDYEKPRITFREPLEVVAAACTPSPPGKSDAGVCAIPNS